jgi:hypothetical protein
MEFPDTDDVRRRVITRLESGVAGAIEFHTDSAKQTAERWRP